MKEFEDIFLDDLPPHIPPECSLSHCIAVVQREKPISRMDCQLSVVEVAKVKRELADYLKKGFICSSSSPWASLILLVKKKDGSMHMCVDYWGLNAITTKNKYPLPRMDELFDQLKGPQFFSKIDLHFLCHQVLIHVNDISKIAFCTNYGYYELAMPFGLTNAPSKFMKLMDNVLRLYLCQFVIVFLNEISVYSLTLEEH